jgi:hypothetical protein
VRWRNRNATCGENEDGCLLGCCAVYNKCKLVCSWQQWWQFRQMILPLQILRCFLSQHDRAPPHSGHATTYLNQRFEYRWLGSNGPITWPLRSPDFIPLDFFLWGLLTRLAYTNKVGMRGGNSASDYWYYCLHTKTHQNESTCLEWARLHTEKRGGHFDQSQYHNSYNVYHIKCSDKFTDCYALPPFPARTLKQA